MVWIKWLGVLYLLWLAVRAWRTPAGDRTGTMEAETKSQTAFWQGLGIALVNPKTLLFNAAFLPQFLPPDSTAGDIVPFAAVYLAVLFAGDLAWAGFARGARGLLNKFNGLWNKIAGGFLAGAGIGLAFDRIRE